MNNIKNLKIYASIPTLVLAGLIIGLINNKKDVETEKIEDVYIYNGKIVTEIEYNELLLTKGVDLNNLGIIESTLETYDYSGMKIDNDYEIEIKKICEKYNIPYEILLVIGNTESSGEWNLNGCVSKTDDYGVFQINKENLENINDNLGYSKDEILNDPIKNAEAAAFMINEILKNKYCNDISDVFGMYNGWIDWKDKKISRDYVSKSLETLNEYFPDFKMNNNIKL